MTNEKSSNMISYISEIIKNHGEKIRFNIGQSICDNSYLPGYIFLIESGVARLINKSNNELTTIKKLENESIIGLSSILRNSPCEEVRASSEVTAWRLADIKLKELYDADKNFKQSCNQYIGDIELIELGKLITDKLPKVDLDINELNLKLIKNAFIYDKNIHLNKKIFLEKNFLFLAQKSNNYNIGFLIKNEVDLELLSNQNNNFNSRILCISKTILSNKNIALIIPEENRYDLPKEKYKQEDIKLAPLKVQSVAFKKLNIVKI